MAKFARVGKPRRFSFENDREKPTVFEWVEAGKDSIGKYNNDRSEIIAKIQSVGPTPPDIKAELETLRVSFIFDRVTKVENLEDQDGNPLNWNTDKEKVLAEFRELPEGPKSCFLDAVFLAHFPANIATYKGAVGGNY